LLTTGSGQQTLGEEYCDISQVILHFLSLASFLFLLQGQKLCTFKCLLPAISSDIWYCIGGPYFIWCHWACSLVSVFVHIIYYEESLFV
jgi:hypothetical protein